MDYIERIDNNAHASDKLQFKEFMESSKRQRYPSYNYEANNDDDIEIRNTKRIKNNRKQNMFALPKLIDTTTIVRNEDQNQRYALKPVIRITSTEDERIEHFLQENGDDTMDNAICTTADILIKSQTTQLFDCDENANEIFKLDEQSDAVIDNSRSIFEIDGGRQSLLSETSSDSNQYEFKGPADTKNFNCENSSASCKSETFSELSQSRVSDLEYIRGGDDWKNHHFGRYEISGEIESDNYHHVRRYSEADDTLEYIRGRDDWVQNQNLKRANQNLKYGPRTSLPRIFEGGEHKILIQDEIDSDEYHHNLFWNDKSRSASESVSPAKLFERSVPTKLKPDNVIQSNSNFVEISNTEINDVIESIIKCDTINSEDIEITVLDLATDVRGSHYSHIQNERTTPPTIDSNSLAADTSTAAHSMDQNQNEIISLAENEFDNTEIAQIEAEFEIINRDFDENKNESKRHGNEVEKESIISEFQQNEIQNKSENQLNFNTVVQITTNPSPNKFEPIDEIPIKKESNMNIQTKVPLTMKSEGAADSSKNKQKLKVENIEDLIRDVSLGPWFHK